MPQILDRQKSIKLALYFFVIVLLDQITKIVVLNTIPLHASIPVIPGFFDFTYIRNPGGAFGFLAGQSEAIRMTVFLVVSTLATIMVFWFYRTIPKEYKWLSSAFAMIFSGAVGNLIDRIRFGFVIDFLDVYYKNYHWPAFNIADSAISIGMGILIVHMVFNKLPDLD